MCKSLSKVILFIAILSSSCVGQKVDKNYGTLKGTTGLLEGNCMPSPGVPPCEAKPSSTTILITELSENYVEGKLVKKITSDEEGQYEVSLPYGDYSLFLLDGEKVVCSVIQCPDKCVCQPFKIASDSTTILDVNLDRASW